MTSQLPSHAVNHDTRSIALHKQASQQRMQHQHFHYTPTICTNRTLTNKLQTFLERQQITESCKANATSLIEMSLRG